MQNTTTSSSSPRNQKNEHSEMLGVESIGVDWDKTFAVMNNQSKKFEPLPAMVEVIKEHLGNNIPVHIATARVAIDAIPHWDELEVNLDNLRNHPQARTFFSKHATNGSAIFKKKSDGQLSFPSESFENGECYLDIPAPSSKGQDLSGSAELANFVIAGLQKQRLMEVHQNWSTITSCCEQSLGTRLPITSHLFGTLATVTRKDGELYTKICAEWNRAYHTPRFPVSGVSADETFEDIQEFCDLSGKHGLLSFCLEDPNNPGNITVRPCNPNAVKISLDKSNTLGKRAIEAFKPPSTMHLSIIDNESAVFTNDLLPKPHEIRLEPDLHRQLTEKLPKKVVIYDDLASYDYRSEATLDKIDSVLQKNEGWIGFSLQSFKEFYEHAKNPMNGRAQGIFDTMRTREFDGVRIFANPLTNENATIGRWFADEFELSPRITSQKDPNMKCFFVKEGVIPVDASGTPQFSRGQSNPVEVQPLYKTGNVVPMEAIVDTPGEAASKNTRQDAVPPSAQQDIATEPPEETVGPQGQSGAQASESAPPAGHAAPSAAKPGIARKLLDRVSQGKAVKKLTDKMRRSR